YQFGPDFPIA
nr:Chain C, Marker peptide [Homo sapiens]5C07_H Chain H, Marker peptide [Homo sapiens]5C0E_C Chain C, Marker peptide [Homo sapiens]